MAFTRVAALLHSALSDVSANQHHTATVAGDLNLADMAERLHASTTSQTAFDHHLKDTQAQMEAELANQNFSVAERIRFSPGVAKVWVKWEQTGANSIQASYNMTSVTDGGATGDTDHLFDVDFDSDEYAIVAGAAVAANNSMVVAPTPATILAAGVTTETEHNDGTADDNPDNFMVCYGQQV